MPGSKKISDDWSAEAKLAVVIETSVLSESELSEYCRHKSLYPRAIALQQEANLLILFGALFSLKAKHA